MTIVLGVKVDNNHASACLAKGRKIVAAANEERFSREKHIREMLIKAFSAARL